MKYKIILGFCLSLGVLLLLFVAGVAVPSLLYSSHAVPISSVDSLRNLDIAGITFSFKLQTIGSALLGGVRSNCGVVPGIARQRRKGRSRT